MALKPPIAAARTRAARVPSICMLYLCRTAYLTWTVYGRLAGGCNLPGPLINHSTLFYYQSCERGMTVYCCSYRLDAVTAPKPCSACHEYSRFPFAAIATM